MEQTFEYPNLLSGTRSGAGWHYNSPEGEAANYVKENNWLSLEGTSKTEFFLWSPSVVLHKGIDYTLHCLAANTANMSGTELWVLDGTNASDSYNWIGAHPALKTPGPGGVGSMPRSGSMRRRGTACRSICASTTTAPRTARTASSGSATSCSWRARNRGHGHRQMGRCGLSER